MSSWLVRFGYDGRPFAGWARQPGLCTLEGTLLSGLQGARNSPRSEGAALRVASRTDRGVSARGNAFVLRSDLRSGPLLRWLNAIHPAILCDAARPVPDGFNPRRALRRTYRYFQLDDGTSRGPWESAARLFSGPVDARSFGRGLTSSAPYYRTIESISITEIPGGLRLEVSAPSFVWGMVRKIVGALREHAAGRLPLPRLALAIQGRTRLNLPMAEPNGLVLWEVEYPDPWTVFWDGPNRGQRRSLQSLRTELWIGGRLLESFPGSPA